MKSPAHEAAAQYLLAARNRRTPGPRIPVEHRPTDIAAALAIQARVAELVAQPIGGFKCSVPTEPRPVPLAPIFAPTILAASPYPVIGSGATAKVEPEIAFVLARDLPRRDAPYTDDEVRNAIAEVRFVLEIIGSRFADPGSAAFPELLADNVNNQGLFVGPVLKDPWRRKLEAFPITVTTSGAGPSQAASYAPSGGSEAAEMIHEAASVGAYTSEGVVATRDGKHPDGHPLRPLVWLASYLAARGDPLRAGMIVTTGSYCGIVEMPLDQPLTFAYGDLGTLAVTLTRAP